MALATTALAEARAKLEMALAETQAEVGDRLARECLASAGEALVAARRGGDNAAKLSALELLVQANMHVGDLFAASLAATDELAMIKRTGDKTGEAKALQLLGDVHVARGDNAGAADSLQGALTLQRELGDRSGQAKSLRQLAMAKMAAGKKADALAPAQDALKLYEEIADADGKKDALRTVNMVFAEQNQVDKAPSRPEALQALQKLAAAVEGKDGQAWTSAMDKLKDTCAYTQKDIDDTVANALEKDRIANAAFLDEQGIAVQGDHSRQLHMSETVKAFQYVGMRVGGLMYGPRFRCLRSYKKQVGTDEHTLMALSTLQISEEADDWEMELMFHPGCLDGMLQSNGTYS